MAESVLQLCNAVDRWPTDSQSSEYYIVCCINMYPPVHLSIFDLANGQKLAIQQKFGHIFVLCIGPHSISLFCFQSHLTNRTSSDWSWCELIAEVHDCCSSCCYLPCTAYTDTNIGDVRSVLCVSRPWEVNVTRPHTNRSK